METGKSCCVFLSALERERDVSHFVGEKSARRFRKREIEKNERER